MKNKISDLRNHLFETLERLKDEDNPMDLARARAISDVAQTVINSAKVEIEFLEVTGQIESTEFFDSITPERGLEAGNLRSLPLPGRRATA